MTDLEYDLDEARTDDADVFRYAVEDEPANTERVAVVALTAGDRTMMASLGWGANGPFVTVTGYLGDEKVRLELNVLADMVMIRQA